MLRRLVGAALVSVVAIATAGAASSQEPSACKGVPSSCNEDRTVCCEWWMIDLETPGSGHGAILEQTYEKLQASLAANKKTSARLCQWGFKSDCATTWSAPHCQGGSAAASAPAPEPVSATADKTLRAGAPALERTNRALEAFGQASNYDDTPWQGASAAALFRTAIGADHAALVEYATMLHDTTDRIHKLKGELGGCYRSVNPFADWDESASKPGRSLGYGYPSPRNDLPTMPFVPPSKIARQQGANGDARTALGSTFHQLQSLPDIKDLTFGPGAQVTSDTRSGRGRIVFGSAGTLQKGSKLAGGAMPVAFITVTDRGLTFGAVDMTTNGDHVQLVGHGESGSETIVLLSCKPGMIQNGNRCDCPGGLQRIGETCGCPADMEQRGNSCVCSDPNAHNMGGQCLYCLGGTVYNGAQCVCPSGTSWNGNACVGNAPPPPQPQQPSAGNAQGGPYYLWYNGVHPETCWCMTTNVPMAQRQSTDDANTFAEICRQHGGIFALYREEDMDYLKSAGEDAGCAAWHAGRR